MIIRFRPQPQELQRLGWPHRPPYPKLRRFDREAKLLMRDRLGQTAIGRPVQPLDATASEHPQGIG